MLTDDAKLQSCFGKGKFMTLTLKKLQANKEKMCFSNTAVLMVIQYKQTIKNFHDSCFAIKNVAPEVLI